jgi:hypothetical protein
LSLGVCKAVELCRPISSTLLNHQSSKPRAGQASPE